MADLWPLLAVAGLGALHGLNPLTGWAAATAWGLRAPGRAPALRALAPIALGHVASLALVAATIAFGLAIDRGALQVSAATLLILAALVHLTRRAPDRLRAPAGRVGLALSSFIASTLHGAGLMLVPALIPLCAGGNVAGASGAAIALAGAGVHMAAMLGVTGLIASGVCRGVRSVAGRRQPGTPFAGRSRCAADGS